MDGENKQEKQGKSKKIKVKIGIAFLVIVIIALGGVIYWLLNREEEPEKRMPSEGLIVDPSYEGNNTPTFTTDMNMIWTFQSGKRVSNDAVIGNSSANTQDVYFDLYLADEEETLLYSSPVIPVGKRLDRLKLDKALPDGRYEAVCTFHLLDNEDHEKEISSVSFDITLIFREQNSGDS